MPLGLLKYGLSSEHPAPRFFRDCTEPKKSYDAVIIGGGGHGLAAAYYLAKDYGITNVAVLEKGYIGGGNTGRNTTIVRSNYLTPEGVNFYDASVKLYEDLSEELDLNLFYSTRGHFTLAHTESAMRTMRWRAEVNKHVGVESYVVGPEEISKACPQLDISCSGQAPILGALYHAPGSVARHDAVAWGYAKEADRMGVEIFQMTEVTGIDTKGGKVVGVNTSKGYISTNRVLSAVAGFTPRITEMVDLKTPIVIHPLQACVSEPMKPWLDTILVSGSLHVYVSQSSRGELVMGSSLDPYEFHSTRSSLDFVEGLTTHITDMFPFLSNVKVVRQWAGMADITPDFAPIMGKTPLEGFYLDAGWGTWGFKATPISGKTMAETIAKDMAPDLIKSFRLSRFEDYELTGEKGAASVGH
ncbi:MAG: FAD-dependent oxidoreductase [Pseudomonadota bacterium]|jgi:sarcosine oxidase, subunit beta|uniref:Glycine/D-amino acid oxidase n=2 Tax=Methylophaga TaxID=40222 RepID=F5T382_9GAMM|nr:MULTISPECIES: FAD-dependent oxidoreductase [Methylophaga]MEC9411909.1 FAD-dependent oxidoreductase [Pseudomonadota bacterium]EGL53508.1 glycine/D-amino acid oxidase [Methylophaga aminisulfidivorans MP]WVI84892.1 FAD-dependent oxidoreductase [Methylophaga thalassica]GLP99968.1 sarcosine oxidase subunit beta [Methylophaga thalassica]HIC46980.1 FAD-dependent oxidoreductase [Methylophaga sp.]